MTERSYQDAVQALKRRLGGRWEGFAADGRDEMVQVLKDELGYDNDQANDAIDAMVDSGTLRYREDSAAEVEVGTAPAMPAPPAPMGTGGSSTVAVPPTATTPGYWQIGEGEGESTARKGQVTPT